MMYYGSGTVDTHSAG